jgi:hypothetical protein
MPSTSKTNLPTNGGSIVRALATLHSLPCSLVQPAHLLQQSDPVAVLEIEQGVEIPVQVVREVRDLLPEFVLRVAP